MKRVLKSIRLQAIILAVILVVMLIFRLFNLPNQEEVINFARSFVDRHGYPVVFSAAFLEAIPGLNIYFPGSSVIFLSATVSRQGSLNIFILIFVASAAFMLAHTLNYFLGKYGWYRILSKFKSTDSIKKIRQRLERRGNLWLWFSYVQPNLGALTATAYGVLQLPFGTFFLNSLGAVLIWSSLWGVAAYFGSELMVKIITLRWAVVTVLILLIILKAIQEIKKIRS